MANPFTEPTLTGYNATPPADDGSEVASNEVTWAKHKDKLGDPLKTYAAAISTGVTTAFDLMPFRSVSALSGNTTLTTTDRGKFYSCTGTWTLTLLASATAGASFTVAIQNNGTGAITIDGDGTETINGESTIDIIPEGGCILTSDGSNWVAQIPNNGYVGQIIQGLESSRAGYLLMNGQTMGNATSGATDADAKYERLFAFLWDNVADGQAAVSSGRGTTAAADWAADKTITLLDMRGRVILGKDNMGGSSADVVTDTEADTIGDVAGQETITQTEGTMVAHTHAGPSHTHGAGSLTAPLLNTGGGSNPAITSTSQAELTTPISGTTASASGTTGSTGSGNAIDVMTPYMTFNVFIRY